MISTGEVCVIIPPNGMSQEHSRSADFGVGHRDAQPRFSERPT